MDPRDIPLLGFQVDNQIYFHCVLPFGGRSCILCCQGTRKSVVYILEKENISADVYIDDFFGAETPELANMVFCRIKELFKELHLEVAIDKDVPPTYKMLCLGVMVDALELALSVPEFRIAELTEELERWTKLRLLSKRDVQHLLGKLSYVAACVPPGRPFLASMPCLASKHVLLKWKFQVTLGMIYNGGDSSWGNTMGFLSFPVRVLLTV